MSLKIGAAYVRVSTDDQLEYSPESQLKAIRDYAKREGFLIPDEYIFREDDGISGRAASKRPAFRLMIATAKEAKAPPFEAIFVWKFSRFARNQEEAIMYKNLLRKRGVDVRSISEPSNDSPFSSLIERIIEWMDEYYLINLAEEVRRGMKEKAARGEAMGNPPFGYDVREKTFVPNKHAPTVRYIFERFAAGAGCRELARELGDQGVLTSRGNLPDSRWISYMLKNPTYIGKIRWSTTGHANYARYNFNGENVMTVDGRHEPIISPELWQQVQDRLSQRSTEPKNVGKKQPVDYMLKGLIRCSACGATLTYGRRYNALQCHKYSRGQCSVSHFLSLDTANEAVLSYLQQLILDGSFTFSPAPPPASRTSTDWAGLIRAEEKRLTRARQALLDGLFTSDEYRDIKDGINETLERLRAAQTAEAQSAPADPDPDACRAKVRDVLQILADPAAPELAKNKALRSIIDRIVYNKPEGTLDIYFSHDL